MKLLKKLVSIHAPSGEEIAVRDFIIDYIKKNQKDWKNKPELIYGKGIQDCLIVKFGKPRTAVFCHMDSVGFHVKYGKEIIKIGSPVAKEGTHLIGYDSKGLVECTIKIHDDDKRIFYETKQDIERGTSLTFKPDFRDNDDYIESCYLDNRLGIWVMLKLMETLENGLIAFTSWEENGGGSASYIAKLIYEQFQISQALVADITWVTGGVYHGKGVVLSQRDTSIPRKSFFNKIRDIADQHDLTYQIEVENAGGSDGSEIQKSPYPIDWLFIGAPEDAVHSPNEKVHKNDIESMLKMYQTLMKKL